MKKTVKKMVLSNWSLSEKALVCVNVFLVGVMLGWLTSPFKHVRKKFPCGAFTGTDFNKTESQEEK